MNQRTRQACSSILLVFAAPCFSGCFDIKHGETKTADDIVKTQPKVVPSGGFVAKVALDGSKLTVSARPTCALVEMEEVKHTTKSENELEGSGAVGGLTALGILGSIPLTAGVVMLADSPKVFDSSRDSRTYNPTGKGAAIALGSLLTAIGGVAVTIPLVNAGRAAGSDTSTSTTQRQGKTLRPTVTCDGSASPAGLVVTAQAPILGAASLGTTDAQGNVTADLKVAMAGWFTGATPPPVSAGIYVNSQFVGEIRVAEIARATFDDRAQQEELFWGQAEPHACESQRNEPSCARVRTYIATFPTGRHLEEAQRLIQALIPTQPVVVQNPAVALVQRAVATAREATNLAANKVRVRAEKEHQKALLRSEEEAVKAGKLACDAACKKVCEEPLRAAQKTSPDATASCKTTCEEEACP